MKLLKNKKAGVGNEWFFVLSIIFGLSVMYILFNIVFVYYLEPIFVENMPDTEVGQDGIDGIHTYLTYWKFIPFLILGSVIMYLIIITIKREPTEY